ncbi:MAG: hypothetical protein K1X64_11575 [Myxococcaceae bacterium]|nr:hypothetical protein [Myxococcaceae bacterium]
MCRAFFLALPFLAWGCSLRSSTCGEENDLCCEGATCASELQCRSGVCLPKLVCETDCTSGQQRCTATGGIELCIQPPDACPTWQSVVAQCPGTQRCRPLADNTQAECADACPSGCALESIVCTSGGPQVCQTDPVSGCPVFVTLQENPDAPLCVKGACSDEVCWENPVPTGATWVSAAGWATDQFMAVDALGNLLRNTSGAWSYAVQNGAIAAVAVCDVPGRYVAVGRQGALYAGSNFTWTKNAAPLPDAAFNGAACTSNLVAIAVGRSGVVAVRNTLGNWLNVASGTSANLLAVSARLDNAEAWAVGLNGNIVRCTDLDNVNGNINCLPEMSGTTADLYSVWADPADARVFAVGAGGLVLERTPTGWVQVAQGTTFQTLYQVTGVMQGLVMAVGGDGTVLTLSEGEWHPQRVFPPTRWSAAFFGTHHEPVLLGDDGYVAVGLAPAPWKQMGGRSVTYESLKGVHGTSTSDVYAVGTNGLLLHRAGDVWRPEAVGRYNHTFKAVRAVSANEVYAVGSNDDLMAPQGIVTARRAGRWATEALQIALQPLNGVTDDGVNVVAVGIEGTWLEKPLGAGGDAWAKVAHQQGAVPLNAVAARPMGATGSSEVVAVGDHCTVLRKVGGVFSKEVVPGCDGNLSAVWVGSDGDTFVGGTEGQVFHRTGQGWEREFPGCFIESVTALAGASSTVFATCENNELYQRSNGSWRTVAAQLSAQPLYGVWLSPQGELFVVGGGGTILRRR